MTPNKVETHFGTLDFVDGDLEMMSCSNSTSSAPVETHAPLSLGADGPLRDRDIA
jgi:hypothetical protein